MFNKNLFSKKLSLINNTYSSMTEFAKKANFDRTYISKYINKKLDNPPTPKILEKIAKSSNSITTYEELMEICGYLNISEFNNGRVYINTNKSTPPHFFTENYIETLNKEELKAFEEISQIIINKYKNNKAFDINAIKKNKNLYYHKLSNNEKDKVLEQVNSIIDYMKNLESSIKDYKSNYISTSSKIPILGTVKAGYDWLAEENVIGYITDRDTIKDYEKNINEYFALKVTGDSMLPLLSSGDLVIVHDQDDVESGQTAVILINGEEATVKKVIKTNEGIELHAMNPYYPIKKFTFDDMKNIPIKIIGRVKEAKIKGAFE